MSDEIKKAFYHSFRQSVMQRGVIIYWFYVIVLLFFVGGILVTPFLASNEDKNADALYDAYSYTCHQKLSRSVCLFKNSNATELGDCIPQTGEKIKLDYEKIVMRTDGMIGYKFPVCSRDIGIYVFMLLAAFVYPFLFKPGEKRILPPVLLIAAIIPLAFDGGLQLISEFGWFGLTYESTNIIRLITGGIAGAAVTFYLLPIANRMFGE